MLPSTEELFLVLYAQAPVGMAFATLGGTLIAANPAACRQWGRTESALVGTSVLALVHPDDRDAAAAVIQQLAKGDLEEARNEQRFVRADDSVAWIDVLTQVVLAPDGAPRYLQSVLIDVTARRRTDDARSWPAAIAESSPDAVIGTTVDDQVGALRALEARKSAILDAALDCVITMDHEGQIIEFNSAAERVFGYPRDRALGRQLADLIIPPDLREAHRAGLARYLATGEGPVLGQRLELRAVREDGGEFPVEISITRVDLPGRPVFTASLRDITDRKRTEEERTVLEDRLRQSERLESVGQLAGGIAHDFNNLLAAIMNYAAFVAEETTDRPAVRADVEQIQVAAERAARLTKQLLTFARRDTIQLKALDLNAIVADIHNLLSRTIGEHIQLSVAPAEALPTIGADTGQIEQVLLNLAINARDAMPDGGTLTIATRPAELDEGYTRLHPDAAPGHYVELAVSDTGTGMSPEVAGHIFEPFFTTKPKGEGTGLGLATVYGIVRDAGGTVSVYSEAGIGTTFRLYFPAAAAPSAKPSPPAGLGETVLVVEDEDAILELTARILRRGGYHVLEAATFEQALSLAAANDVHLLLTDSVMPEMSGRALAEQVAELRPGAAVLYMSGYSEGILGSERLPHTEAPLLQKPFSRQSLLEHVQAALRPRRP